MHGPGTVLKRLWQDDGGALIATEWLALCTILVLGSITGLVAIRQGLLAVMTDTANAVMSLDQSYWYDGQGNRHAVTAGSTFINGSVGNPGDAQGVWPHAISPGDLQDTFGEDYERSHGVRPRGDSPVD